MRIFLFFILFLAIAACVDPITINSPDVSYQLAIDGLITDEPGPYTINIFRAAKLNADLDHRMPVSRAVVTISDDAGNTETLIEDPYGVYKTAVGGIQGTVGRTYTLKIITLEGKVFESLSERMRPVAEIDSLYYEFESKTSFNSDGQPKSADGFAVYMDASSLPEEENLYRWRYEGTYQIETFPQYATAKSPSGQIVPAPLACSGWEVNARGVLFQDNVICECCICWISQFEDKPMVSDDQFVSNNKFKRVRVAYVPITPTTFNYKYYHVNVKQMSLSPATFNFWKVVASQKTGATSLFQPAVGKARSNIFSKNGSEEVQGIFSVSAVKEKSIFISRSDIPYKVPELPQITTSCKYLENSTNIKPDYWK